MDIKELQNYRLDDAIKFNNKLNPRLWGADEHLLPEVKQNLMAIAEDFREFLGISNLEIKDITVSGSNAAYTYTPHSDIDLHLIVDLPKADASDVYRELFDAKKYQYNDQHNFTIGGYPVELYVQNANETHHSQGIYSLLNNDWVKVPSKRKPTVDDISVKSKYEDIGHRIEQAIASGSLERMSAMGKKIKDLRQSGLDTTGEFGPENLAFKILRNTGLLEKLRTARLAAQDKQMSLTERDKNKKKIKWGKFGGQWFPGYHNYGQPTPEITDGDTDGEVEEVKESATNDIKSVIDKFVNFCADKLDLDQHPLIKIKKDPAWSERNATFGKYDANTNTLYVSVAGRHPIDIMRTIAHELAHRRQDEIEPLPNDAGNTGSTWENEANAVAGIVMRDFGQLHPEYFELNNIDEDYDPNGPPPGPETRPTMPAGTVKVDVSDVYDWYKLGQHISNLKGLGQHDFGQGPPSAILSFGSEEEEHKYIQDLEKTGLTTTDIDPVDPNQPKNMPRQKTDPTYNVTEAFDQPYELLRWEKGDFGDVDAIARLDDGTFLSIMFNKGFSKDTKEEAWSVEFWRNNSQEVTGEGDQQRVFATVLSAIQQFIDTEHPDHIRFSANKDVDPGQKSQTRSNLYNKLVQRYANSWGYSVDVDDFANTTVYNLYTLHESVTEGSLEELTNTSLKVKEPKNFVNVNDRKQVTYKVMKFKSGKDTYLINFTVKGAPAYGKKSNWNAVNVSFGVREPQDDYSFGDEINTDLTARNKNQFLIYSTVINAVRKFITEYNTEIDEIIMQGAGERQAVMYQRFFQSAGKYFPGWHYDGKHSLVRDVPRQQVKKVREQGVAEDLDEAVGDNYLYHATMPAGLMRILRTGAIKATDRPQPSTKARTQYPTISTTRSKQYAESNEFVDFLNLTNDGNAVILVFDRNAVANHYKMFGTSQGTQTVGDEFEEVIVAPRGSMPIRGTLKGFYFNPNRTAEIQEYQDVPWFQELLSSPYYMGPKQGVTEGKDFDRCFDQACKLYDRAVSKNLKPKLVQVADFQGDGNGADPRWLKLPQHVWQHYVVIVGDQVLDPTAKQFGDTMPTQYQVSDLDRLWAKQYQIRPRQGVAEATGFIPVDSKLAHDPRYVSGLTVDIKPGETQRQAKKLGWKIDKNGSPPLLMQELERQWKIIKEGQEEINEEDLLEIKMTGKNLRAEAAKTGAIAGMEFEMIVPNVEGDDDDAEPEPDWDQDEGVRDIDDAVNFFDDSGQNSRGDLTRLRERMQQDYWEWLNDRFDSRWESDEFEFVYNYLVENASDEEIAEILGIEPNEDGEYPGANKKSRVDATDKVIEEGYGNYWYDQARENAQEDYNNNADQESEWLEDREIGTMRDVMDNFGNVDWPHYYTPSTGGDNSIEDVANDFQDAIGRDVRASTNYHAGGVDRPSSSSHHYVVEPDGSLEGDDYGDKGLEFVSPPLPIDVIINDLNKVKRWAKSYGCYTNDSTGLHINISVPNYSRENLDFVKLAILMGDEYVSNSFGRLGAFYAKSAMGMIRDNIRSRPEAVEQALEKMKTHLDTAASKAIHSGVTTKYTSINTKEGHIEFRSPGGDWLDENFDKIENTLLRFTVAMSAALNPEMYREEYLKKLYKMLNPEGQKDEYGDMIQEFSKYMASLQGSGAESSGKLSKETQQAIKDFRTVASKELKQKNQANKLKKGDTAGQKYWWKVSNPGNSNAGIEVVATTKQEAIEKAISDDGYPSWASNLSSLVAKPLSPYYEKSKSSEQTPKYEIYNKQTGNSVEPADGITNDADALVRLNDYIEHGPHALQRGQATAMFGIRTTSGVEIVDIDIPMAQVQQTRQGRAQTSPTGQWKITDGLGRYLYVFRPAENTRAKANELAALWARENNFDGNYQVEPADEQTSTPAPGSTTDLARQRAAPGTFTGAWRVLDADGNELHRFSGIGNVQSDANRVAVQWMRDNGYEHGTDISVVPIMTSN